MRAFEIPDWLTGKKIRRRLWPKYQYVTFNGKTWIGDDGKEDIIWGEVINVDWEEFKDTEPKKIKLFRYTYNSGNETFQSPWMSCPLHHWAMCDHEIYKTDEKEIEI